MKPFRLVAMPLLLVAAVALTAGCAKKSFNVRDVEPDRAGTVRSLGPESQDVIRVADLMTRSLLDTPAIARSEFPPTIAMLPLENNTRFPFNKEIFTTRLKAELNQRADGRLRFVSRDVLDDVLAEREAKRAGELDYDPERRTIALAGADYFLKGRIDGQSGASRMGQSEYMVVTFKLIDAESTIEMWENFYEVKREGRDDVLYR